MTKKSVISKINKKEQWNDLFKFEMEFEDGSKGMMYKKTDDPKCEVGDDVNYTLSDKGTIKILTEGQQQFNSFQSKKEVDDEVIMLQCMFKAAAQFQATKGEGSTEDVIRTAKRWYEAAKDILKNKDMKDYPEAVKELNEIIKNDVPF